MLHDISVEFQIWISSSINYSCYDKLDVKSTLRMYSILFLSQNVTFVFEGGHNVNEISKELYDNCNLDNENMEFGQLVVSGLASGTHYFACGIGGGYHCEQGVKAIIHVVENMNNCPFSLHWIFALVLTLWFWNKFMFDWL